MYLTSENLVHYLLNRGLVTPSSVVDGDFVALESRRRNRNYRVLRAHDTPLFVKQVPVTTPETTSSLSREATCYRMFAEVPELSSLKGLAPRLLDYNPANHTLVTELLSPSENLGEYHFRVAAYPEPIASSLGRTLARIHGTTARLWRQLESSGVFSRQPPWVLSVTESGQALMPGMNPVTQEWVTLLRQLPEVTTGLAVIKKLWRPACLIHGDVKWDNFLLTEKQGAAPKLHLIDWELSDLSDPAWDVACVFAAYVQSWILSQSNSAPPSPTPLAKNLADSWPAISAFWAEYARGMGISAHVEREQLLRSVHFVGARLILIGFEILQSASQMNPIVYPLLNAARQFLADPMRAQSQWLGLTDAALEYRRRGGIPSVRGEQAFQTSDSRPVPGPSLPSAPVAPHADDDFPQPIRTRLEALLEAVEILSPGSFRIADQPPVVLPLFPLQYPQAQSGPGLAPALQQPQPHAGHPGGPIRAASPVEPRAVQDPSGALAEALWPFLYSQGYARTFSIQDEPAAQPNRPHDGFPADATWLAQLSAANQGRNRWDPAWEVYQIGANGAVHVRKGDVYRLALAGEYAFSGGPGRTAAVGQRVDLLVLREANHLQNGFYYCFGETVSSEFDDAHLGRVYFHCRPEGICAWIAWLTAELNRLELPFRFKCLSHPGLYRPLRSDSAVLYVAKRFLPQVLTRLNQAPEALRQHLAPSVPLFTREFLPGIGTADDPGHGESFGQSRMRLVSRAIVDAWIQGRADVPARLQAVKSRFQASGLSVVRTHLNPGNADIYAALN